MKVHDENVYRCPSQPGDAGFGIRKVRWEYLVLLDAFWLWARLLWVKKTR